MKLTIIGAGGVRTPLIVEALARRQVRLGLTELALMDIDAERLAIIAAALLQDGMAGGFETTSTTDPREALASADFVITTFRVGGAAARVVDERVPLSHGVLGQETTGPGGFAMAMRSVSVLLDYVELMREVCPRAWLINFANPSGLLTQAAIGPGRWPRTVGICDAPEGMRRVAAAALRAQPDDVFLDYFGLNHLGWVKGVWLEGRDHLPALLDLLRRAGGLPGLPFAPAFLASLGMIPNEYLYYYYHSAEAVRNILAAGQTRGEQIVALSEALFADLRQRLAAGDHAGMRRALHDYLAERGAAYMTAETGSAHTTGGLFDPQTLQAWVGEGYAGIALDLIEALQGGRPRQMILNIPNAGAVAGLADADVVEIPACVGHADIRPLAVGATPQVALGLMQTVKAYERLTIEAAVGRSYATAVEALTIHPLVRDYGLATAILAGYIERHGALFPRLA
jgi:6-phospho-beta-glucosidase